MTKKELIPKLRFPEFVNEGEWEKKKLKSFGNFYRGLTYATDDIADEGLLVLRSGNIQNETLVLDKDLVFVKKACPDDLILRHGDIVICMSNGSKVLVGKNAEYKDEYDGILTAGAFCSIMRPHNKFAKYFLQTDKYQRFIALSIGGGNINNLKNSDLEEFECISSENINEQQKIASCLSSLDEVIAAESQKLDYLKDHKKGLMQNLFPQEGKKVPKYRFKEFEKDGEWVKNELSDFCFNISSGKDKNHESGEFELYGSTGIIGKTESPSYRGNFILVARVGANAGLLNRAKGDFGVTDNTLVLDLKKVNSIDFIYYNLEKIGLNKLVFGSGQPLITGGQLKSLILFTPKSDKEQQKIASCLSSLDELITAQIEKIEQFKLHKKGLMQGLFPKMND